MPQNRMMIGAIGTALVILALPAVTGAQDAGGNSGGSRKLGQKGKDADNSAGGGPGGFRGGFLGTVFSRSNGQGGRAGGTNYMLLDNPAVQEDLKVTKDQKRQIKEVYDRLSRKREEFFSSMNEFRKNRDDLEGQPDQGGQEDASAKPAEGPSMLEVLKTTQAEADALLARILNKSQRERLDQIELRRQGPLAVLRPDIAEKLNIGLDQQEQMEMLILEAREEAQQFIQARRQALQRFSSPDGQLDHEAMRARRESREGKAEVIQMRQRGGQIQDKTIKEIGKILTKRQKEKFNAMLGKPFDLAKLNGPDGPRGPGEGSAASGDSDRPKPQIDTGSEQDD